MFEQKLRAYAPIAFVIAVQVLLLAAIPAKKIAARAEGTEITLRTRPVDPYDILAGYYVTLAYEVEVPSENSQVEPGLENNHYVFLTVERGSPAWSLISVSKERPSASRDRVSIRALWANGRAQIEGAGRLYIPEAQRTALDTALRQERSALVDLAIGSSGEPAVLRLRVQGQAYGE